MACLSLARESLAGVKELLVVAYVGSLLLFCNWLGVINIFMYSYKPTVSKFVSLLVLWLCKLEVLRAVDLAESHPQYEKFI